MVEGPIVVLGSTGPSGSSVVAEGSPWNSDHSSAPVGVGLSSAETTAAADADSVDDRRRCEWEEG